MPRDGSRVLSKAALFQDTPPTEQVGAVPRFCSVRGSATALSLGSALANTAELSAIGAQSAADTVRLAHQAPKPSRNVSKSPGRYGSSLSPGRLAAAKRVELAAARAQGEEVAKLPQHAENREYGAHPSSRALPKTQSEATKISMPGKMGSRSVKAVSTVAGMSGDREAVHAAAAPREEVKLDHLSSMLASGELQQAWGTAASSGAQRPGLVWPV
jgi:hypothetical protein